MAATRESITDHSRPEPPRIFSFRDYRDFLAAEFAFRKAKDPGFSLRVFARHPELGLSSSSFLSAVLKRGKNLSQALRLRIGRALGLKPVEQEYFELLVQANQSRTEPERAHYGSRLARFHGTRPRILSETEQRFFSRWWYAAVWHWIGLRPDQSQPARIAKAIRPPLSVGQAEEAVRVLLDLGLIRKLANGYAVADRRVASGSGFRGEPARAHVREYLRLAADSLERVPPEAREHPVLTLALSARGRERLRERIEALWAEARELAGEAASGERIYALGLQLFPCSEESPGGRGGHRMGASAETGNPRA
jgi:uncharacterized protein (TIGR02147 family)